MTDPHLIALGQIEADKATGRITPAQYEKAKAELTEKHQAATRPWRIVLLVVVLLPVLLIGGCFALIANGGDGGGSSTTGYQTAVRKACADQVRNRVGQATFRDQRETSSAASGGSTNYTATGRADTALGSVRYTCSGTVAADADKTLTTRLLSVS